MPSVRVLDLTNLVRLSPSKHFFNELLSVNMTETPSMRSIVGRLAGKGLPCTPTMTVSAGQLEADVLALASPDGRVVGTAGHERARRYLLDRMEAIGLRPFVGESLELPYRARGQDFCNLVGVVPGTDPSKTPVLIGAHYDSVIAAPCADDNAAAVAIALGAAARLIATPAARTVVVAIFDAEEPPHYQNASMGSIRFYEDQRAGQAISAAVIMDLVGHDVPVPDPDVSLVIPALPKFLFVTGAESHRALVSIVEDAAGLDEDLPTIAALNRYVGDVSDHHVFRLNDVPYLFLSCGRWEHYHMPSDTPDKLNYGKMARILEYLLHVVRAICDRELTKAQPTDTVDLEIKLIGAAIGPLGMPMFKKAFGLDNFETREDLDQFAAALMSAGL